MKDHNDGIQDGEADLMMSSPHDTPAERVIFGKAMALTVIVAAIVGGRFAACRVVQESERDRLGQWFTEAHDDGERRCWEWNWVRDMTEADNWPESAHDGRQKYQESASEFPGIQ